MRERQHIYEDLNESSSASPGGSQQLEIRPSLNSKRAGIIFQSRWFFSRRGDFNARQDSIVRLFFCMAPTFWKSACFSGKRQYFPNPADFFKSANIFQIRLIFWKAQEFCKFAWFFLAANICVYLQYLFLHLSMRQYFIGAIVLTLGLRLML